jgi:hypothetical protein
VGAVPTVGKADARRSHFLVEGSIPNSGVERPHHHRYEVWFGDPLWDSRRRGEMRERGAGGDGVAALY